MKRLLIAVTLALMPSTVAAQATYKPPPPVEQALLALEQRWVTAAKASDGAAVGALLADNFVAVDADGSMRTKAELVERTTKGKWTVATLTDMKVVMHGNNTGIVTGVWAGVGTDGGGKAIDGRERWADTWVKADGKWRFVASASHPGGEIASAALGRFQPAIGDDHPSLAGADASAQRRARRVDDADDLADPRAARRALDDESRHLAIAEVPDVEHRPDEHRLDCVEPGDGRLRMAGLSVSGPLVAGLSRMPRATAAKRGMKITTAASDTETPTPVNLAHWCPESEIRDTGSRLDE